MRLIYFGLQVEGSAEKRREYEENREARKVAEAEVARLQKEVEEDRKENARLRRILESKEKE